MEKTHTESINLQSQARREIMGYIPHWIIRAGISVIFFVIVLLLIGSWFFKYPDIIRTSIVLTAENPPASIIGRSDGKLEALFVEDKQKLLKGDWIGVIENTSDYNDVRKLKEELFLYEEMMDQGLAIPFDKMNRNLSLGEIQKDYFLFIKACNEFQLFYDFDYYSEKIIALNKELTLHKSYSVRQEKQKSILKKDLALSKEDYQRDSILMGQASISRKEFENRYSSYLQKQFEFETLELELSRERIQMLQLEQKLMEIRLDSEEESNTVQISLLEALENLLSVIEVWEQDFVLKAPVDGYVTFADVWNINHNVVAGEKVMTIVPDSSSMMIGRMKLPVMGSGKVMPGLDVNIRFSNYPPAEYGIVKAKVDQISLLPEDNFYIVEVSLPDGLKTSYGKTLEFHPEMQGKAEIITEDQRLLVRILRPLKALFKNN